MTGIVGEEKDCRSALLPYLLPTVFSLILQVVHVKLMYDKETSRMRGKYCLEWDMLVKAEGDSFSIFNFVKFVLGFDNRFSIRTHYHFASKYSIGYIKT